MPVKPGLTAFALGMFAFAPAFAQTDAPASPDSPRVIPEKQSPTTLQGGRSESLSSKLTKSGGVITPNSNVDPGMRVPAPDAHPNSMPVIPPSATGGNSAK